MKKLGTNIGLYVAKLAGDSDEARINLRAMQVRDRYREVMKTVYRDTADVFLAHTNNVYIMKKNGVSTLIVYVDDSLFSAELNAQRELIKLKLLEQFGEAVEEFEIHVSRGSYKGYHPFLDESVEKDPIVPARIPLDSDEVQRVQTTVNAIENESIRKALEKAMTADLERKKGEKGKTS